MKRLAMFVCVMSASAILHAAQGDWTNFLYVAVYGDPAYWLCTTNFAGGSGTNSFNFPQGILADGTNVFVCDTGNDRIVKLRYHRGTGPSNAYQMSYVEEWGGTGSSSNQLRHPSDMSFGNDGLIYIADMGNHCVKVVDINGNWQRVIGAYGTNLHQLNRPTGLCVVPTNGNVMVANYGNSNIVEFTSGGAHVRTLTNILDYPQAPSILAAKFQYILGPYDVVVIGTNLYITEAGRPTDLFRNTARIKNNNGAKRFILVNYDDFTYIADWNLPETNVGCIVDGWTGGVYQELRGLIDFDGYLLFACADNNQNQHVIADSLGYIIGKFGTTVISGSVLPDNAVDHFAYPHNLAKAGNFVFCADSGNNRISMWKKNSLPCFDWPKTNWFSVRELQVLAFTVHAKDDDGDAITYAGTLDPAGDGRNWGVNSDYMKFSMIPNAGSAGTDYLLTLLASDGFGTVSKAVTIHVDPVNQHHKKLAKQAAADLNGPCYEDYVFATIDDGDLVTLRLKKGAMINHWDGSVLDVSGSPTISLAAKRAKTCVGSGPHYRYDTVYGEVDSTNEYARAAVAQLDIVRAREELKGVSVAGSLGRVLVSNAALGKLTVKSGCLGGVEATTIKSIAVSAGKVKDVVSGAIRVIGGDISGSYYPGSRGGIHALGVDPKKLSSIGSVSLKGGAILDATLYGKGHIGKVAAKEGKDENKLPIGGFITNAIIRAGIDPASGVASTFGTIGSVSVSRDIDHTHVIGAAYSGAKDDFQGIVADSNELYYGSVKSIKCGKAGRLFESLVVSSNTIKKLVTTNSTVIINGQIMP